MDDIFQQIKKTYEENRDRYAFMKKVQKDIRLFLKSRLTIDYPFRVEPTRIQFQTNLHSWDAIEDLVADIAIQYGIAFERHIYNGWGDKRPEASFISFQPAILPLSKLPVKIEIQCGSYMPPECHVKVEHRRTWSRQASYSYSCGWR